MMLYLRSFGAHRIIFALLMLTNFAHAQNSTAPRIPDKVETKKSARANPVRTGSISGRVLSDGGQPLADVTVYAATGAQNSSHSANTDADGNFRITDLTPAAYSLTARLPGYVAKPDTSFSIDFGQKESGYYYLGDNATLTMIKGGVITGKALNAAGEAIVGARVQAIRIRDANNLSTNSQENLYQPTRQTDDRGIYRFYGLAQGTYLIAVGGATPFYSGYRLTAYDADAPTYYPSAATRDTASEIAVRAGEEASGIDIRYRGERGHTVSGTILNAPAAKSGFSSINITLYHSSNGTIEATTYLFNEIIKGFAFDGVADGEYDVAAQSNSSSEDSIGMKSLPAHVSVRGANVSGLKLALQPLGYIKGRVRFTEEPNPSPPSCAVNKRPPASLTETALNARRDEKDAAKQRVPPVASSGFSALPNADGDFTIRNLEAGRYRLQVRPPNETLYVASIENSSPTNSLINNRRDETIALQSGERKEGSIITLGGGAAQFGGRVVASAETSPLPAQLRVYLVPLEPERINEALRYAETFVDQDGAFTFKNIAPGRYQVVARVSEETSAGATAAAGEARRPFLWDAENRTKVRRAIEATERLTVTLQPCQSIADYSLRYSAPSSIGNADSKK